MSPAARAKAEETAEERIGLHNLRPAPGSRRPRKRVGRGEGSGTGKTAGRGQKGYGSRSGAKDRARFEGGQMPIHMRMRKLRGPHMKKSMPFEPFRTHTQPVNLLDLEARFDVRRRGHARGAQREEPRDAQRHPGEGAREGRDHQAADRPRPRLQCGRARAHRGRRGNLPDTRVGGLEHARDDPERLHSRGHPQEARVHRCAARPLPARRAHTGSGHQHGGGQRRSRRTSRTAGSSTCSTRSPAGAWRGSRCSRSGSCRTSRPRSSCSC